MSTKNPTNIDTYSNLISEHIEAIKTLVVLRRKAFLQSKGLKFEDLPLRRDVRSYEWNPDRFKLNYQDASSFYHWRSDPKSDVPNGYRIENIDDLLPSDFPVAFSTLSNSWKNRCWEPAVKSTT
jgi:hypothetical protein